MTIQLEIYSDLICPWCYIGKRRLEAALKLATGQYMVRASWHPFELNPNMPKDGMDRRAYRAAKFGSWEGLPQTDVEELLSGDRGAADVRQLEQAAHETGVQSVPLYVLNGRYHFSGAQPPQVILAALAEAANETPQVRGRTQPIILAHESKQWRL